MAGDEIGTSDQIAGTDWLGPEAQVGHGHGTGFFRVIDEISLRAIRRVLADDLDRVLVGAHRAVGAQTEEDRPDDVVGFGGKSSSTGRLVWDTSSLMPTVKWFLGEGSARLSNTALTMAGVNSLEDRP